MVTPPPSQPPDAEPPKTESITDHSPPWTREEHDAVLARSRHTVLLALANLTGFGLGYLPIGRRVTFAVLAGFSGALWTWNLLVDGFWLPVALWIAVAVFSAIGILVRAGLPSYSERTAVPFWQPLALALTPALIIGAAVPVALGPNRDLDERIRAAITAGDCVAVTDATGERSWWMSLLRPVSIDIDDEAETSCEALALALDQEADDADRLAALESHLEGAVAWREAQGLRTELTALVQGAQVVAAVEGGDHAAIAAAVAQTQERFEGLEADVDTAGSTFAQTLLNAAEQPCGLAAAASALAAADPALLGDAYGALDDGLAPSLLACTEARLDGAGGDASDYGGTPEDQAKGALQAWVEVNPDSVHQSYAQELLAYIELRSLLPEWPRARAPIGDYCDDPVPNPLLDPDQAEGVLAMTHSDLDGLLGSGRTATDATTAAAALCADIEWAPGPTCTYVGTSGRAQIETLQPVLRWDLWDLASGDRVAEGSLELGSGCASSVSYEVWNGIDLPPSQVEGAIDEDAAAARLDDAVDAFG